MVEMSNYALEDEARVFGRYLLGSEPTQAAVQLYCRAICKRAVDCSRRDDKIIRFALCNPSLLSFIDGALAFSKERSVLREKLLIMTAILETQPEHADLFLPQEQTTGHGIIVGLRLCAAAFRLVCGKIVLCFI
jgi:hypothetical protein